ncbi:MAG: enoyl-CoA hydratase [Paracoccus sp. (in: a-proteobacteria)]
MNELLLREDHGAVTRLIMTNPAQHNALSLAMIEALIAALDAVGRDDTIRVVILSAAGRAYCAGHDLREMHAMRQQGDSAALSHLFTRCAQLMQMLPALPQPVIAQVQGVATAAGCQLVASCDLAVASETSRFGVNGVSLGLFCATPMVALTRAIPPRVAFEMLTTGDFISAARAAELGLINRVAAPDDLEPQTMQLADSIAAKLPAAIRMGKRAFHAQSGQSVAQAYQMTTEVMCQNMMRDDTAEGVAAFLEKRPPDWS